MVSSKLIKSAVTQFGVQYNFTISSVFELLLLYHYGNLRPWVTSALDGSIFVGAILGMLTLGYLGDLIGRSKAYAITLAITAVGALLCALTSFGSETTVHVVLIATRFIVGIGLGGAYPLTSAENFEEGGGRDGSVQAAWALFWQVPGQIVPYAVGYALSFGPVEQSGHYQEVCIHVLIALGALPALLVLPMAVSQVDEATFEKRDDREKVSNICDAFSVVVDPRYRLKLLGTASCWMLFNFVSYGISLYSVFILEDIFAKDTFRSDMWQNLVCCAVCVPACILTIMLIKPLTPRTLQVGRVLFAPRLTSGWWAGGSVTAAPVATRAATGADVTDPPPPP